MRLTSEDRIECIRAIWSTFQSVHKVKREMSSAEYVLALRWVGKDAPLATVLQGICETSGKVSRLGACERAVEENISRWYKSMGGLP